MEMQVVKLKLDIIFRRFPQPLYAYINVGCKIKARAHCVMLMEM